MCDYAEAAASMKRDGEFEWIVTELKRLCAGGLQKFQQPVRICYVLRAFVGAQGFNRALLERLARYDTGPETRKVPRSS